MLRLKEETTAGDDPLLVPFGTEPFGVNTGGSREAAENVVRNRSYALEVQTQVLAPRGARERGGRHECTS